MLDVKQQVLSVIADLEALGPDVERLDSWRVNRVSLEAELAVLRAQIATAKADREEAIKSRRFELEGIQRKIANAKHELAGILQDRARLQEQFAKLVVEVNGLRKQRADARNQRRLR